MTFIEFEPVVNFEELDDNLSSILKNYAIEDSTSFNSFNPKIDISEDEKNIYLEAELPGVRKENMKIKLEDNKLTITGEKKNANENDKNKRFFNRERSFGSFKKAFTIQADVKQDNIRAEFGNGVLSITIEKLIPEKKEMNIEIK